jgi:uncharacterized protein (UPF0264 family)
MQRTTPDRTQLLVSVRSAAEAAAALAGGADIVDIKEPARGPLGAADWSTIAAVVERVADAAPVSAALGELCDWSGDFDPRAERLSFVKFGLAGCKFGLAGRAAGRDDWQRRWRRAIASLPPSVAAAPVAYADEQLAQGPSLAATIDWAAENGCSFVVIDTFCKEGLDLTRFCDGPKLGELLGQAHRHGLRLGLAGGLAGKALETIVALGPDLVGVRGAACRGGRLGEVDASLVRSLAALVARRKPD